MIKDVTTIAVELAKDASQVAYGDGQGRVLSRQRIPGRRAFALQLAQWRDVVVVMESCATAHYWDANVSAFARGFVCCQRRT